MASDFIYMVDNKLDAVACPDVDVLVLTVQSAAAFLSCKFRKKILHLQPFL